MEHSFSLITTLAAAFGSALVLGLIAEKLKLPALVGYLIAGILIGPVTPGFVADAGLASQLSEVGIMLLMFGVGLHFSLQDLMAVKRIAIPGALVQMSFATLLGVLLGLAWGWSLGAGLVFGLSLSCASTVVLLKALESRSIMQSMNGKIAIGWLVVEDLATVLVLVLLPPLAGLLGGHVQASADAQPLWQVIGITLAEVMAFVLLMMVVGKRVLPRLLWHVAKTGSRELFTLGVVATAIGIAYGAAHLFSVSFALGAFFAGMVMRESEFSHRAADDTLPLRDAFSVLFFVSVGMLFDPHILLTHPMQVLTVVGIILLGKSLAAAAIVMWFKYPLNTVLTVAASLAQIGEFSFILAGLGLSLGLIDQQAMSLVLAGAIISISVNPFIFAAIEPFRRWAVKRSQFARTLEVRQDPFAELPMSTEGKYLAGQVVIVGYGKVGERIADGLKARNIPFVIAEQNREMVEQLRKQSIPAVSGDAADPAVLIQAHIKDAAMLVITTANAINYRQMIETARTLNPSIQIVLREETGEASTMLAQHADVTVFDSQDALAKNMAHHVVEKFSKIDTPPHG